ncbi:MAG: hypothetical protein IKH18_08715 [Clostridia bacterium]|nr:hypothetical protein [Clostridia bacterium]
MGVSVTQRIGMIKQPRGGYLPPSMFREIYLESEEYLYPIVLEPEELYPEENVFPSLVGTAVEYLGKFMAGVPKEEAFRISIKGARRIGEEENAEQLLKEIQNLDENSVKSALKIATYDTATRGRIREVIPTRAINPDKKTIKNAKIMVKRFLSFLDKYGPMVLSGFNFEGGYSETVDRGDADFSTADTIWDMKVLRGAITTKHTLQLLMYWIMGERSVHPELHNIKHLGIFNPRKNLVYRINTADIPPKTIQQVEKKVIEY